MKSALCILVGLGLAFSCALAGDGGDWFSVSGLSFVEAVGAANNYLLVARDSANRFSILAVGEEFAPGMVIKKIGSEQVLVARNSGQEQTAAPILRQQIPADVLVTAICRLYGQNLVIGCVMDSMAGFSEGLLNYKQELPGLLKSLGFEVVTHERALVVRKLGIARKLPAVAASKESGFIGHHLRAPLSTILAAVATQTGASLEAKSPQLTGTVASVDLTAAELAGYLAAAFDTDVTAKPPPSPEAAAAPAPVQPAALAPPSVPADSIDQAFQLAVSTARGGDYRKSAGMLLKLVRTHKDVPAKVTNLLGKLLWSLGRKDVARKAWMYTLKHDPTDGFARRALAKTAQAASARKSSMVLQSRAGASPQT